MVLNNREARVAYLHEAQDTADAFEVFAKDMGVLQEDARKRLRDLYVTATAPESRRFYQSCEIAVAAGIQAFQEAIDDARLGAEDARDGR